MASSITASSTTSKITFTVTLANPIAGNYLEIGVTNQPFTNGTSSWPYYNKKKYVDVSDYEICSTTMGFSITTDFSNNSLVAGNSYTFYGYAKTPSGQYWCIPASGSALIVTMQSQSSTGIPTDLTCVKRWQIQDDTYSRFTFTIIVPNNTTHLQFQISDGTNTSNASGVLSDFTYVSGRKYQWVFDEAVSCTTYSVKARVKVNSGSWGSWGSAESITAPPSRALVDDGSNRIRLNYSGVTYSFTNTFGGYLRAFIQRQMLNYDFDKAMFSISYGGIEQTLTHKTLGSQITALSNTVRYTMPRNEFVTNNSNGVAIQSPSLGTYTAEIHFYKQVGSVLLQPVDRDGNEIYVTRTFTVYDVVPTGITVTRKNNAFYVSLSGGNGATGFAVYLDGEQNLISGHSGTIDYVGYGQSYTISAHATEPHWGDEVGFGTITSAPKQPQIDSISVAGNTATISCSIPTPTGNFTAIKVRLYDSSGVNIIATRNITSASGTVIFSGLSAGNYQIHASTYYTVNGTDIYCCDNNGSVYYDSDSFSVGAVIAKYVWQVATENALRNQGYTSVFTFNEWNDIVDKVKEVLDALGYSWDTTYSTYANAKMSASDRYLTAVRFNSVRNNIGIHYATGISTKLIGDYVYGSDILLLVSKLNSWIDTL